MSKHPDKRPDRCETCYYHEAGEPGGGTCHWLPTGVTTTNDWWCGQWRDRENPGPIGGTAQDPYPGVEVAIPPVPDHGMTRAALIQHIKTLSRHLGKNTPALPLMSDASLNVYLSTLVRQINGPNASVEAADEPID